MYLDCVATAGILILYTCALKWVHLISYKLDLSKDDYKECTIDNGSHSPCPPPTLWEGAEVEKEASTTRTMAYHTLCSTHRRTGVKQTGRRGRRIEVHSLLWIVSGKSQRGEERCPFLHNKTKWSVCVLVESPRDGKVPPRFLKYRICRST
jgi:hypothetical protein